MEDIAIIEAPVVTSTKQLLLDTPVPIGSNTYKPVSHKELMDITLESINTCGFQLSKELYSASNDGMRANGKYHLSYGNDPDMGLMIAWQNSYDKKLSLKFGVGSHVFICENGMICADMGQFKSKHIGQVQQITPEKLREYICRAGETFQLMVQQKERMKEIEVTKRTTAELLGRMYLEEKIITSTQLNIIKGELDHSTFEYGYEGTVWELMNHCTYALKTATPNTWMKQQIDTHRFYTKEYQLV